MIDVPFEETPYGILKRVRVIERWLMGKNGEAGRASIRILDFGCGTGDLLTVPLAQTGNQVLGVDVHQASINQARRRNIHPNLEFRVATTEQLLTETVRFDFIVCSEIIEHLNNPAEFLKGMRQLLTPGGQLVVTTPNGYGAYEILCWLERAMQRLGVHQWFRKLLKQTSDMRDAMGFLNQESVHVQFFRLSDLERVFKSSGFRIVEMRARTIVCGPYADLIFSLIPFRRSVIRLNASLADRIPLFMAADWMFLLQV